MNTEERTEADGGLSGLTDVLGKRPKFVVAPSGGLHCLYLDGQDGPYIWGFVELGEALAIKKALNQAMFRSGCMVPNAQVQEPGGAVSARSPGTDS